MAMRHRLTPRSRLAGLGQQQAYGIIAAGAGATAAIAKAATSSMTTVSSVASAIPIVGGIVAAAATLLSIFHVGRGCGNACIESSQAEQVFEVAAENVNSAYKAGMISGAQALAALEWLQQQGDAQMASLAQSDSKAKAGQQNMDKALGQMISSLPSDSNFSAAPTAALDANRLESSLFIQPGAPGWYAASVSAGASMALQAIAEVAGITSSATSAAAAAGAAPEDLKAMISAPLATVSAHPLIALAVVGGLAWLLLRK